ncbi:unnamed protein product, partial [Rotaria magnacalcarata]
MNVFCRLIVNKYNLFLFNSPAEPNRYSIDCFPKENARQKPRSLKKLEDDRQLSMKGGRAQFT